MTDIGRPIKTIEIEPLKVPVPEREREPEPRPMPTPMEPREPVPA